jgi:DNA-binding transcriptional LysR family regulator
MPSTKAKPLDLNQMDAFLAVFIAGSFSAAALRLRISQSVVTRRIQDLERALGSEVMVRDAHTVRLTPVGHRLLPAAYNLMEAVRKCRLAVGGSESALRTFKVGCNPMALTILPEAIDRLRILEPPLHVELVNLAPSEAMVEMENGRLDLAFVGTPILRIRSDFRQRTVRHVRLSVASYRSHPIAQNASIPWCALDGQKLVLPCKRRYPAQRRCFEAYLKESRVRPSEIIDAADAAAAFASVAGGRALAILPDELKPFRFLGIEFVVLTDPIRLMDFAALWHRDADGPQLERLLAECTVS